MNEGKGFVVIWRVVVEKKNYFCVSKQREENVLWEFGSMYCPIKFKWKKERNGSAQLSLSIKGST